MLEPREPRITVEGVELSEGQALSVRVAVSLFLMQLGDEGHRAELGPVADGYRARLSEVANLMASPDTKEKGSP